MLHSGIKQRLATLIDMKTVLEKLSKEMYKYIVYLSLVKVILI